MSSSTFTVFADMNCPFCYALNERLNDYVTDQTIIWRYVEHSPNARYDELNLSEQSELAQEIANLRHKAPEIIINIPLSRPNSHRAALLLIEAERIDSEKAKIFRKLIYQALWLEGKDIGNYDLLRQLASIAGLVSLNITKDAEEILKRNQHDWENGEYYKRIPAIIERDNKHKFLGLPEKENFVAFLDGKFCQNLFDSSTVCEFIPKQKIIVVENKPENLMNGLTYLQLDYIVEVVPNGEKAITRALTQPQPDLIIMDINLIGSNGFEICHCLKTTELTRNIPVIFLSDRDDITYQMKAFGVGASDYILKPFSSPVLKCRIDTHLKLKRVTELLDKMARIDSLTELANRREFERFLEIEWQRCRRVHSSLAVMMIDIDFFKNYNDLYGHTAGDKSLKKVAQTLWINTNRRTDFLGRYGGEEFVAVLPSTDKKGALKLAKRYLEAIEELKIPHKASHVSEYVTISIGVTSGIPLGLRSPLDILNAADKALYQAKKESRNSFHYINFLDEEKS